jgi:hypothetical protein
VAARFLSSRDQITQSGKIVRRIIQSVSEDEEIAIVAGLHTLGSGDTGNTVNCHFHSQDAVVRSHGGGAKPETIQDDTRKTLRFGGR